MIGLLWEHFPFGTGVPPTPVMANKKRVWYSDNRARQLASAMVQTGASGIRMTKNGYMYPVVDGDGSRCRHNFILDNHTRCPCGAKRKSPKVHLVDFGYFEILASRNWAFFMEDDGGTSRVLYADRRELAKHGEKLSEDKIFVMVEDPDAAAIEEFYWALAGNTEDTIIRAAYRCAHAAGRI